MLYRMDRKPDWNVFLNMATNTTAPHHQRTCIYSTMMLNSASVGEAQAKRQVLVALTDGPLVGSQTPNGNEQKGTTNTDKAQLEVNSRCWYSPDDNCDEAATCRLLFV